jgi:hypothetical protein
MEGLLVNNKLDGIDKSHQSGGANFELQCNSCPEYYIGQTGLTFLAVERDVGDGKYSQ